MEKQEFIINQNYHKLLLIASTDKNLTSNQFRVFFYISTHSDIVVKNMQNDLNFKTTNLMSDSIKALIKNGYITRSRTKKKVKKNTPFYVYELNLEKALDFNFNKLNSSEDYFKTIENIYNYFFKLIPTSFKVDTHKNFKSVELMLYKDERPFELIKQIIDFVASTKYRRTINRPFKLRKEFEMLLDELNKKQSN